MAPYASRFDDIMRETYLKIVDIDSVRDDQAVQLSLPLRHGGCGLRNHTIAELHRLFVSSAMLVAPAVHAATGYSIEPVPMGTHDDDDTFSPFEYSLRSSIENLNAEGISPRKFGVAGPIPARKWASGASEKLYKKTKIALLESLGNLPEEECKYSKARIFIMRRKWCTVVSASPDLPSHAA